MQAAKYGIREFSQMKVLVINAGSSSLKYQLLDTESGEVMAKGLCERIGIDGVLTHTGNKSDEKFKFDIAMPTHKEAIQSVINILLDPEKGVISSMSEIDAVGHRVVHGGEFFSDSVIITEKVIKAIEDCVPLAPLHNPPNLTGIQACREVMGPDVPMVAVFDTAFKGADHHADGKQRPRKAGEKENDGADPFQLEQLHAHIAHEGKEVAEKAYGLPIDPIHELIQDCRGDKIPNKYCSFTSGDATRPPPFRATALTAVFTYFIVCPKLWVSLLSGSYPSFWQTKS
mgnify:CR=1 FL=1